MLWIGDIISKVKLLLTRTFVQMIGLLNFTGRNSASTKMFVNLRLLKVFSRERLLGQVSETKQSVDLIEKF